MVPVSGGPHFFDVTPTTQTHPINKIPALQAPHHPQPKYTRESLLGLSNRTKGEPALPCEPGLPAHSVLTVLGRMEHS